MSSATNAIKPTNAANIATTYPIAPPCVLLEVIKYPSAEGAGEGKRMRSKIWLDSRFT
jgi:hypothetical protein